MPLLVDGHNLIGRMPGLSLEAPDDEARLVAMLRAYVARTGRHVIVVFDPSPNAPPSIWGETRHQQGKLEVIFAAAGRKADDVLREHVAHARDKQGLILVTSDAAVAHFARQCGLRQVRPSEWFVGELRRVLGASPSSAVQSLSAQEVEAWLAIFPEPPSPPPTPAAPKPDPQALKRQRRLEQLRKQVANQHKLRRQID
ncbi:MAG: NYN domain-containing protein [Anaerolineae bacterium]|nr:NYN domain-containing protein [Thermoflexales bacterium]MDW8052954.1 NYN domain-containing protein [Anaerolineae bacterium]